MTKTEKGESFLFELNVIVENDKLMDRRSPKRLPKQLRTIINRAPIDCTIVKKERTKKVTKTEFRDSHIRENQVKIYKG